MNDAIVMILLMVGGTFSLIAALGLLRFPDVYTRMHASTKAGTLGVGCVMAAVAVTSGETLVIVKALATVIFLLLTAPVAAHMLGRAAYRARAPVSLNTMIDAWQDGRRPDHSNVPPVMVADSNNPTRADD